VDVAEDQAVPTATGLWHSANWHEREVYDLFGVPFSGHPDLRRLLCHHEFEGHALRKDYPIEQGQECSRPENLFSDEDIARAAVYLMASDYVTGQIHEIDGGRP
jgi:NADH:ubiquinone oxidoreductase subunit C